MVQKNIEKGAYSILDLWKNIAGQKRGAMIGRSGIDLNENC